MTLMEIVKYFAYPKSNVHDFMKKKTVLKKSKGGSSISACYIDQAEIKDYRDNLKSPSFNFRRPVEFDLEISGGNFNDRQLNLSIFAKSSPELLLLLFSSLKYEAVTFRFYIMKKIFIAETFESEQLLLAQSQLEELLCSGQSKIFNIYIVIVADFFQKDESFTKEIYLEFLRFS